MTIDPLQVIVRELSIHAARFSVMECLVPSRDCRMNAAEHLDKLKHFA